MKFDDVQLPAELLGYIRSKGLSDLYPPQEEAIKAGLLEGRNLVISSPTASGKTLIALIGAYLTVKLKRKKVVYLTPLRALASEKYSEFSELDGLGIKTMIATGDFDSSGEHLGRGDVLVLTNEKFDSILRHGVSWLNSVGLFVADEVHLAGTDRRGPTLEMILTKVMHLGVDSQLLALSATISNTQQIADWLNSSLVRLEWRPVPLREGVYDYGRILFTDGEERVIPRSNQGTAVDVALESISGGGQALLFAGTRRRAVSLALKASEITLRFLTEEERLLCSEASRKIRGSGEETGLSNLLADIVDKGAAFHHAGLRYDHRKIVEDYYRMHAIKLLSSTPTLCLPKGEEIFSNGHPTQIQLLDSSHKVLTHRNRFSQVVNPVARKYSGPLLEISTRGQLPMSMTPEHMILRVTRKRHSRRYADGRSLHWWSYSRPGWIKAKDLMKGDFVLFPRIKETKSLGSVKIPAPGPLRNQFGTVGVHWTPLKTDRIALDETGLEALGLYIAEGYTGKNGVVAFAINQREKNLTKKIGDWFSGMGLNWVVKDLTRQRRVVLGCSKQLAMILSEMFGSSAEGKRLPDSFLFLPKKKLVPLARGLMLGDGSLSLEAGKEMARYQTSSRILAKQLFAIFVKIGFMPSLRKAKAEGRYEGIIDGHRIYSKHDKYVLGISGKQFSNFCDVILGRKIWDVGNREYNVNYLDRDYYYMMVRRIAKREYEGEVYNLEVKNDSSYVGSFVVHNSMGLNIPARRVVIADLARYDAELGMNSEISVLEYRQMSGRAGRPQYDKYGEAITVPPPSYPADSVLEHYARGKPEPIESRLASERAMRVHVLSGIASSLGVSKADVEALFSRTLFAVQYGQERVNQYIERALEYLTRENLVVPNGPLLSATGFGKRVSTLYIDPATGVLFRKSLEQVVTDRDYTVGMLHLVVSSPDFEPRFAARNKDMDEIISFLEEHSEEMILKPDSKSFMDYEETLHAMRSVMALYAWINEWKEDMILDRLGVEPGDLHRAVDNADWLLYSLGELAKMFRRRNLLRNLNLLRRRMINGVKEELVQLTTLEGVGRVRARALYGAGFRTLRSIREAELGALSGIDKIGPVLAKRLKDQVSRR